MAKRKNFHAVGIGMYKHRWHVVLTIFVVALPFLFILFAAPLTHFNRREFLDGLLLSTLRLLVAYAISLILAIFLAVFFSQGKIGSFFLPIFDVLQSFPTFAMLPLVVYWFGPSTTTVVIFLVVTVIWPMLFAIVSSLKLTRQDWEEAATVFGARGYKRVFYFTLPVMYPGIVTGSIVGLGEGWEAVVGAEIIVGANGLGSYFSHNAQSQTLVLFGVTALLLFVFTLNKIVWLPLLAKSHKLLTD